MFWFNPNAFKPIIEDKETSFELFKDSLNKNDGDIEHAFERIFAVTCRTAGFSVSNVPISLE